VNPGSTSTFLAVIVELEAIFTDLTAQMCESWLYFDISAIIVEPEAIFTDLTNIVTRIIRPRPASAQTSVTYRHTPAQAA
jgi:hypothetical protein